MNNTRPLRPVPGSRSCWSTSRCSASTATAATRPCWPSGWRGAAIDPVLTVVEPGDPLPDTGHVYLLGGGEDAAQVSAVRALQADGGLHRAVDRGAVVFAVCAGYQIVGELASPSAIRGRGDRRDSGCSTSTHHPRSGARGRVRSSAAGAAETATMHAHRVREPRRLHQARSGREAAGRLSRSASATATTGPRARSPAR